MDARHADETRDSLELIPWDPNNETQSQRLYDQRVACGWACDMVDAWKDLVGNGDRIIYWIVSPCSTSLLLCTSVQSRIMPVLI